MKTNDEIGVLRLRLADARTELRTALLEGIREAVRDHGYFIDVDEEEKQLDVSALLGDGLLAEEVTCVILNVDGTLVTANDKEGGDTLLVDTLNDEDLYDLYRAVVGGIAGQQ